MNNNFEDLEGRVATALRAVAGMVPDEPPHSFSDKRAWRESGHGKGRSKVHTHKTARRVVIAGVSATAVCGAVLGGLAVNTSSGRGRTSPPSTGHAAAPAPATPTPHTTHYQVIGYTSAQATTAAATCLGAAGAAGEQGAALRATFSDTSGSTLVVATPTGWNTCDESADGTVLVADPFESYAEVQGWGLNSPPAGNLSAQWLIAPVELDSYGGGYLSKSTMASGWLEVALGRVAPNITKVTVQMPGGSLITASVENGFFVARQLLASPPATSQQSGTIPIMGYDSSGKLVNDSMSTSAMSTSATPPPCFVTSSGRPVTPNAASGQKCQTATAW